MEVLHRKLFRTYKAGYQVWDETVEPPKLYAEVINDPDGDAEEFAAMINDIDAPATLVTRCAYTPSGDYIGSSKIAHLLCKKRGIAPECLPGHEVCSIGFCEKEQKWYGWSHRAICGFGVGDVVKKGDCTTTSGFTDEWLTDHPEDDTSLPVGFIAKNLMAAKRMAIAFAESVG